MFYNGFTQKEMANSTASTNSGWNTSIRSSPAVLFDIQSIKGRRMNKGEEIKVEDLQKALKAQNMSESDIKPGDAVFMQTGWGELWKKDNATSMAALRVLSSKRPNG